MNDMEREAVIRNAGAIPYATFACGPEIVYKACIPRLEANLVQPKTPRARRYTFVAVAELAQLDSTSQMKEKTTDLSLFGCHIGTRTPWPVGTKVNLRIAHKGESFAALGSVAHVQPGSGMGILFTRIEPNKQAMLDKWIAELRDS